MPKVVDAQKRRQEIIRTAIAVFAELGYEATNLSDISARLGFARTTIYKYFKNKDEILDGVIDEVFAGLDAAADERASVQGSAAERLRSTVEAWFKAFVADPDGSALALDMLIGHGRKGPHRERARVRVLAMRERLRILLQEGVASGEFRAVDPVATSYLLFATVQSFSIQAALYGNFDDSAFREAVRLMLDTFAKG